MSFRIKVICCLGIMLLSSAASSQTGAKVNRIEDPVKVSSVETEAINSLDGVAIEAYCKNCKEILEKYPASPDGTYTIDPDGSGPIEEFECYCDMTTDGGGWTMVGNYKSPASYEDYMQARSDASFGSDVGNPNSTTPWTDWRILAGVTWPAEFVIILDRATFSTDWDGVNAKVIYRVKSRDILPNNGTTTDLSAGDNLYFKWNCTSGWTDVGSSSYAGEYYWYPYSSDNKYLILFHGQFLYLAYYGFGVPDGDNTWYHSARMLIR